ncbi:MAG TPA: hypothetical protein EYH09_01975 [Candidatus Nanopusillus sp.]|nr:hypothetical protein [Candidatus Nanopusillus sp.]HIP90540.1 hypothetical protein [Candidatus Nanopusillus sp.]
MDWKTNLDPLIRDYLNQLLKEVIKYRAAYSKAKDISKAQIWVALALLYREIILIKSAIEEIREKLYDEEEKSKIEKTLKKY